MRCIHDSASRTHSRHPVNAAAAFGVIQPNMKAITARIMALERPIISRAAPGIGGNAVAGLCELWSNVVIGFEFKAP